MFKQYGYEAVDALKDRFKTQFNLELTPKQISGWKYNLYAKLQPK
jgi:hypothetical protein